MSELEEMPHTCKRIEIPPKPNKKEANITLIPRLAEGTDATKLTPDVSSINPEIIGTIKFGLIFNTLKVGFKITNISLNKDILFSIERRTLKKTTNPPINTTDFIAFIMLVDKIFPKSLNERISEELLISLIYSSLVSDFQNLNIKATVKQASM